MDQKLTQNHVVGHLKEIKVVQTEEKKDARNNQDLQTNRSLIDISLVV